MFAVEPINDECIKISITESINDCVICTYGIEWVQCLFVVVILKSKESFTDQLTAIVSSDTDSLTHSLIYTDL